MLPDTPLTAGQVTILWVGDRAALATCRGRHAGLSRFYNDRDKGLAGK